MLPEKGKLLAKAGRKARGPSFISSRDSPAAEGKSRNYHQANLLHKDLSGEQFFIPKQGVWSGTDLTLENQEQGREVFKNRPRSSGII